VKNEDEIPVGKPVPPNYYQYQYSYPHPYQYPNQYPYYYPYYYPQYGYHNNEAMNNTENFKSDNNRVNKSINKPKQNLNNISLDRMPFFKKHKLPILILALIIFFASIFTGVIYYNNTALNEVTYISSNIHVLKINVGRGNHPSFSPDGSKIVYKAATDYDDNLPGIWIMDSNGTNQTLIYANDRIDYDSTPGFNRDMSKIIFAKWWSLDVLIRNGSNWNNQSGHKMLFDQGFYNRDLISISSPMYSYVDNKIVYDQFINPGEIWIMEEEIGNITSKQFIGPNIANNNNSYKNRTSNINTYLNKTSRYSNLNNNTIPAPILISPLDGATIPSLSKSLKFKWEPVENFNFHDYCWEISPISRLSEEGRFSISVAGGRINSTEAVTDPPYPYDYSDDTYLDFSGTIKGKFYWHVCTTRAPFAYNENKFSQIRSFTLTDTNNKPSLSDYNLTPMSGNQSTIFKFSLNYRDKDNNTPVKPLVIINRQSFNMTTKDVNYRDGSIFEYETKLPIGNNTYYYYFDDGGGPLNRKRLAYGYNPAFSHNGDKIAYKGDGLYIMNSDGSGKKRLLSEDWYPDNPIFLPDGRILFESARYSPHSSYVWAPNLWIMDDDGKNKMLLVHAEFNNDAGSDEATINPNGTRIVFGHGLYTSDLFYIEDPTGEWKDRDGDGVWDGIDGAPDDPNAGYMKDGLFSGSGCGGILLPSSIMMIAVWGRWRMS